MPNPHPVTFLTTSTFKIKRFPNTSDFCETKFKYILGRDDDLHATTSVIIFQRLNKNDEVKNIFKIKINKFKGTDNGIPSVKVNICHIRFSI